MDNFSPLMLTVFFTILGAVLGTILGAGFSVWKEWDDNKSDRKYIIDHMQSHGKDSGRCLKSIEAEFYYFNRVAIKGFIQRGECSPGLAGVEDVDLLRGVYIKSHRHFSVSERKLIEQYLTMNELLTQHYIKLNGYVNDSNFIQALFQLQVLLVQWTCYVETRSIFNKNVNLKKKEFLVDFNLPEEGHKIIASEYGVDYEKVSIIVNKYYSTIMKEKMLGRKGMFWPTIYNYKINRVGIEN